MIWPSIRTFSALTHLEITRCDQADNLSLVFRHASQLRSIDLSDIHFGVFKPLAEAPDALPELTSFRLIVHNSSAASRHPYQTVIRFLKNKGGLRRLYLDIEGCNDKDVRSFADFLPSHTRLEILGIEVDSVVLDLATLSQFAHALPEGLKMFSFGYNWVNDHNLSGFGPLYRALTQLPRLELLRLWFGELCFTPELAHDFAYLHTFALGEISLWDVNQCVSDPDSDSDAPLAVLECWSYRRAKYRCPEDFRYNGRDAEWLLRPLKAR